MWEWDDTGDWGRIVPKTRPHQAISINGQSGKAELYGKQHWGSNQKFRMHGKWLICQRWPRHALAIDAEGNLGLEPIQCDSDKHDFSPIQIHCDVDEEETQEEPGTSGTEPESHETVPTTEEILAGQTYRPMCHKNWF